MAFTRKEDQGLVYFYPETEGIYPGWLQAVSIVPAGKNLPLRVAIHVNTVPGKIDPKAEPELYKLQIEAAKKHEELCGYKELFESISKDLNRFTGGALKDNLISNDANDMIVFDAGPTSKIRSVLNQAGLPEDIKESILEELQRIWTKTPK